MRIALGLEYDGIAFCGWQTQPGGCGVQDHLETALARLACTSVAVTAAGLVLLCSSLLAFALS